MIVYSNQACTTGVVEDNRLFALAATGSKYSYLTSVHHHHKHVFAVDQLSWHIILKMQCMLSRAKLWMWCFMMKRKHNHKASLDVISKITRIVNAVPTSLILISTLVEEAGEVLWWQPLVRGMPATPKFIGDHLVPGCWCWCWCSAHHLVRGPTIKSWNVVPLDTIPVEAALQRAFWLYRTKW